MRLNFSAVESKAAGAGPKKNGCMESRREGSDPVGCAMSQGELLSLSEGCNLAPSQDEASYAPPLRAGTIGLDTTAHPVAATTAEHRTKFHLVLACGTWRLCVKGGAGAH